MSVSRTSPCHSSVQRGLARLIAEQAVRSIDGACSEQHRTARRTLVVARRSLGT